MQREKRAIRRSCCAIINIKVLRKSPPESNESGSCGACGPQLPRCLLFVFTLRLRTRLFEPGGQQASSRKENCSERRKIVKPCPLRRLTPAACSPPQPPKRSFSRIVLENWAPQEPAGRSLRPAEARILRCLPPQASFRKNNASEKIARPFPGGGPQAASRFCHTRRLSADGGKIRTFSISRVPSRTCSGHAETRKGARELNRSVGNPE